MAKTRAISKQGTKPRRYTVYSTISRDIVIYLQLQGMKLSEIGSLIGVKESFISRVRNKERNLTIEHLTKLEKALKKPLPIILMEATPIELAPKKLRNLYAAFHDTLLKLNVSTV